MGPKWNVLALRKGVLHTSASKQLLGLSQLIAGKHKNGETQLGWGILKWVILKWVKRNMSIKGCLAQMVFISNGGFSKLYHTKYVHERVPSSNARHPFSKTVKSRGGALITKQSKGDQNRK
jgi:hypothetical protein